jgi:hypothetical protein
LWFALLLGMHVLLSHASYELCLVLARQPREVRAPFLEAVARVGIEATWRPLLLPLYDRLRIGDRRLVDVHRNPCILGNSAVAVGLGWLAWWGIGHGYRAWRDLSRLR